ncbi:NFACT family protein [Sporomusa sp. KB1]|jgi:predicted ribosome quality control (RQC) complex YloA/Tae2 family protein|uniref:Rqc2 family fibronectin-binding protein n=1 Tax=Sporomusa sp. KB1 TaxID=943346 RepID=UPI0011A17974|nr:NFACT RNA binding domain-containing protein [Sporomusa sp. KB1]TWH49066.1 putative ribosome quality control (RQC) complex YloA/Tae2 family protein [Sporomusa sp. KB1]
MNIDGLSLAPLVGELNAALTGGRIDKVFQPDSYSLLLWVRQPGENLRFFLSANPERPKLLITTTIPENPAVAPNFCMLLRKHLEDGRIASIEQHSLDRIVNVNIDVRGERGRIFTKRLVIEIMGKYSNIILLQDNIIIDSIKRVSAHVSRHRQVLPGKEYIYPPGQDRLNILDIDSTQFVTQVLAAPATSLSKAIIATGIGLGPLTAKELAWRGGFSPDIRMNDLDTADIGALSEAVTSIASQLKDGLAAPTVVVEGQDKPLAIAAFVPEHLRQHNLHNFSTMSAAVDFFDKFKGRPPLPAKEVVTKLLAAEIAKLTRKHAVLAEELSQAENAGELRKCGDILMANLYSIIPGADKQAFLDIYSETSEAQEIIINLNPALSAIENAQQYYTKYNKAKRSEEHLTGQLQECQTDFTYLESIAVALSHADASAEINEIRQELVTAGYIKTADKRRLSAAPLAPLSVITTDGFTVIIGKNNRQNDLVTFKQARPDDIWLHTKDIPGSHVIIRGENREISPQAINEAAQLAAYYSKSRQSASVPVDYTKRRYVRKPSGAKPGFVIYDHQNTVYVTPEEALIGKLLTPQ